TMIGNLADAKISLETSAALARLTGDRLTEGLALTRLGFCLVCQTELGQAAVAYERALERFSEINSDWRRDRVLFGLAVLRLKQGELREASHIIAQLESRWFASDTGWRSARIKLLRGWCSVLEGSNNRAIQDLDLASSVFRDLGAQRDLALCCEFRGDARWARGERDAALAEYASAEALGRMVSESSDVVVEATRKSGEVLVMSGQVREALAKARTAHRLTRRNIDELEIVATSRLRGMIKVKRGRIGLGLSMLSEAWERFVRLGAMGEASKTADWLATCQHAISRLSLVASRRKLSSQEPRPVSRSGAKQAEATAHGIVSQDGRILKSVHVTLRAASLDLPILILGETGTGKELFATLAHEKSGRKGALLAINCAALPADILDAELFGHAKGAYTGAYRDRPGLIEAASDGTLFLDEIGEMSLAVQGRLLRALEAKEIRRLGENHPRKVGTRFVGATHRDLHRMVKEGSFRADLFFRLRGVVVHLPPLRERPDDIPLLTDHFLSQMAARMGREFELTSEARERLNAHPWPGNVRELRSVIERAAAMCEPGAAITPDDLGIEWTQGSGSLEEHLEEEERRRLIATLESVEWNKTKAAHLLNLRRTTLVGKLTRLGIEKPRKKK
ncbi:MAG TPA: sigma 54-interacting transcriptional regulator, partial [Candidatus Eisenbacteria bacterium]|nr:sigma 54-interacting transcriptional regulator [Candidatus Eisenbacteria bacterium]